MSDGMRDSRIMGDIGEKLWAAAYDLRKAIKSAEEGHRGLVVGNVVQVVNEGLAGSGYELRKVRR